MARIVLTGARGRLGRALIGRLAGPRHEWALVGRDAEALAQSVNVVTRHGGQAHILEADLALDNAPGMVVQRATDIMGGIDILVHAAAAYGFEPFAHSTRAQLQRVLDTSLRASMLLAHAAFPVLRSSRHAVLIQIASLAGLHPVSRAAAYSAAKAGMIAFGQALRSEAADAGIALHTVIPGQLQLRPGEEGLPPSRVADILRDLIEARADRRTGADIIVGGSSVACAD